MTPYASFHLEDFPIVTVRFTGAKADDENFQAYLRSLHETYKREKPFTYIFDASEASLPGFKYQKMQADWLRENKLVMMIYCLGTAYVIPNTMVRTVLKGIFALQQQPVPYKIVGTMEEAKDWCAQQIEEDKKA